MNPDGTVTRPSNENYHYVIDDDDNDYIQRKECKCFRARNEERLRTFRDRVNKDDYINTIFKIFFYAIIIYLIYILVQKMNSNSNPSQSITP